MADEDLLRAILEREGSTYTNTPGDRGGPTKFGVTQAALAAYRGRPVTPNEVRDLTESEALEVYRKDYIALPGFDRIASEDLRGVLVDFGVHSGPSVAIKALQMVMGIRADGVLGPLTYREANGQPGRPLAIRVACERLRLLGKIMAADSTQAKFASGWIRRVTEQIEALV